MTNHNKKKKRLMSPIAYAIFSIIFLFISLLILFIYISKIGTTTLPSLLTYILLIPLGLSVAAFLFGSMNSIASWTGTQFSGKLTLGGPVVGFFLTIVLAYYLPNTHSSDITLHLRSVNSGKEIINNLGVLIATFPNETKRLQIDDNGDVTLKAISSELRAKDVQLALENECWKLYIDNKDMKTVKIKLNVDNTTLNIHNECWANISGRIIGEDLHPIEKARLLFNSRDECFSNENGYFEINIPLERQSSQYKVLITKTGFINKDAEIISDSRPINIMLRKGSYE
jgi:hypothetical protein